MNFYNVMELLIKARAAGRGISFESDLVNRRDPTQIRMVYAPKSDAVALRLLENSVEVGEFDGKFSNLTYDVQSNSNFGVEIETSFRHGEGTYPEDRFWVPFSNWRIA